MLEHLKARRRQARYRRALSAWQAERDNHAEQLRLAQDFAGERTAEILLAPGEALFLRLDGVALVEDREAPGDYEGGYSALSIPVARLGGRTLRYDFGATRGHHVPAEVGPMTIDIGTAFVTNRGLVFLGPAATRECYFRNLIAIRHRVQDGETTFSLANRPTPLTFAYGQENGVAFEFWLELALARHDGALEAFVARLQDELDRLERERPPAPVTDGCLPQNTEAAFAGQPAPEPRACERRTRVWR